MQLNLSKLKILQLCTYPASTESFRLRVRINVTFRYPAEFVPLSDEDGILAVPGAEWFVKLLRRVPGLELDEQLCQEDWGVVIFGRRAAKKFWIGLSLRPDGE